MPYILYALKSGPICRWDGRLGDLPLDDGQVAIPCDADADPNDPIWADKAIDPAVQLTVARERLREQINTWRDEQERGAITFDHAGHVWDGSLAVRDRLKPVASLPTLPSDFFWTDANNKDVPITLEEIRALDAAHDAALVMRGWSIHRRQREMKIEIELLDIVQLATYSIHW